ncbi:TPA: hypothetical protein ACPSKE_000803 [Legionella feeleii]|uniref:Uncharacterized protein n=1 Tax=Legionella feeleii TaxID=453 RepID=A0A0W0U869_9GAMM|nr:hypothetical protein [Legionella feeleii]KTD03868.1 hypothetical protein Lfee_0269 [Legionella feeleii]SPX61452.1 Uncharacterised protein [Legionella feeleii]STX36955.1 Uncharacterised protein [Legionella feeleii]
MKRIVFVLLAGLFLSNVQASTQRSTFFCGYKDYFHLSSSTHPGIYIRSANNNQDLNLLIIGPRSFEIRDTDTCNTGYAHVGVAYDDYHWCILDIKDGPYMMHPSIRAACSGMEYKGLSYDGFNTYSYTINID